MDSFEQWATDRQSVLVSLATRGAATFYEHRGYIEGRLLQEVPRETDAPH
jgi:hypothetical protein